MILLLLAAGLGLYMIGRMTPDGSVAPGGFGSTDQVPTELGIAEDGSFVIVEKMPDASFRPNNLGDIALPPSQPPLQGKPKGVGWVPPNVGCAPGKQCCTDCKTAEVPFGEGVGLSVIEGMAAILAQRIALGDLEATRRGAQILALALSGAGRDRFVGEALCLALEQYQGVSGGIQYMTPREAFPARLRVAVDNPDYVPDWRNR